MSVFRRFFEIKDSMTLNEIDRLMSERDRYARQVEEIRTEIGAKASCFSRDYKSIWCTGFKFDVEPDRAVFKKVDHRTYYPKKKGKEGRELAKRVEAIPNPTWVASALEVAGVYNTPFGVFMDGLTIYFASVCGSREAGWFAIIPWKEVDPDDLDHYKKTRTEGGHKNDLLEHLQWTPPAEWVEMREWQVDKALKASGGE